MEVSTPGIYIITADVTDADSNVYSDSYAVLAMDRTALDAMLQGKWEGMKGALISGDIARALSYHHPSTRNDFEAIYTALGSIWLH